jgi:hypothetical protein
MVLTLSGCFEIIEEITIYPDGKGKADLTLNLSQGKAKLSSIMLMDSIKGNAVPSKEEILEELETAKQIAKTTPGLTEVNLNADFDDFIFELNCNFDSVECLNHFVYNLENYYTEIEIPLKNLFSYQNNIYFRNADFLVPNKHKKMIAEEKGNLLSARYISIVRLPFEVEEMSNEKARLAKNKKAVMLRIGGDKLLESTNSVTNKIKIKTQ